MRSVAESVAAFSVFSATSKLRLLTNISAVPVNWSQLTSLSEEHLFQDEFVGLTNLQEIISNMVGKHVHISQTYTIKFLKTKAFVAHVILVACA